MKSEKIKAAFDKITDEVGRDNALSRKIGERLSRRASVVPVNELRAVFKCFIVIFVPVLLVYAAMGFVPMQSPILDVELMVEQNLPMAWHATDLFSGGQSMVLVLVRGVMRAFLILMATTFILTAAVMPVHRHDKTREACHA